MRPAKGLPCRWIGRCWSEFFAHFRELSIEAHDDPLSDSNCHKQLDTEVVFSKSLIEACKHKASILGIMSLRTWTKLIRVWTEHLKQEHVWGLQGASLDCGMF